MEDSRRRQLHSCDPCRKGKRGCDAPKNRKESTFKSCSNCKRWKKECTFDWVSLKRADLTGDRRRTQPITTSKPRSDIHSIVSSHGEVLDEVLRTSQSHPANRGEIFAFPEVSNYASSSCSSHLGNGYVEGLQDLHASSGHSQRFGNMDIPHDWQTSSRPQQSPKSSRGSSSQAGLLHSLPSSIESTYDMFQQLEEWSNSCILTAPAWKHNGQKYLPESEFDDRRSNPEFQRGFCIASDNTANKCARLTMSRNLMRIYHDSMENALSCWLTEHNCPYSESTNDVLPYKEMKEWGSSWSNRMCIRVCRLDHASSSIRGRVLSAEENKTAARVLHLAITSFASQWTQHAQKGIGASVPAAIDRDERSIREEVWNEARHALEHSAGIPSFRIAFANIIFSLTQSPLDKGQEGRLDQLLENDRAPIFLETANRQLFTFRHKFTRLQREAPPSVRELRRGSLGSTMADVLEIPQLSDSPQLDPILTNQEHRTTLGLMFWLGVMFDTLSAAMYQRPLVVSDEDSQTVSTSPSMVDSEGQIDLGCWDIPRNPIREKQDVWGDLFLRSSIKHQEPSQVQPRWPCSYEEAASVLSEATPVKVLLYRRVTQLQTLVYRGATRDSLENVIQKALLVYQHWEFTYQSFMLDCVTNHELLPPRIQSWYVILDGHWHLAAMLLADVLEGIDKGKLGSDAAREARQAADLVASLRMDNAFAVGGLACASIQGQEPIMHRHFHDSMNEVAFLVEPWTAVLVHSFAKAGYILLESLDVSADQNMYTECLRQTCRFCIYALQYLGRKSDMAFLVARNLSRYLALKLAQAS